MIVGLVVNPVSSKDIRRLVGLARVVDSAEKVNVVARLLTGLSAASPLEVLALDDGAGLIRRATRIAGLSAPPITFLPVEPTRSEEDTTRAARLLAQATAAAVVVVGGDGTVRAVVEGWPEAPLVAVSAGTNNALALTEEPTMLGYATALAIEAGLECFRPLLRVEVSGADPPATAVVDAVGVRHQWVGAAALWEPSAIVEGVFTMADPAAVGMASVAAAFGSLPTGRARYLRFGPGRTVRAVLAPGLIRDVEIAEVRDLDIGEPVAVDPAVSLLALDGERRLTAGGTVLTPRSGPYLLEPDAALARRLERDGGPKGPTRQRREE
jgi:predicted polyphosphate/ATP-dependent NAD kinase